MLCDRIENDRGRGGEQVGKGGDEGLTLERMAGAMAGVDDWHFRGYPELGIPSILVADCGHGVTLCGVRTSPATCFPTGIGLASTWNVELMEEVGAVIGRECLALGVSLLLGPMINLHRHPLNGRSFETFSEDPVLAGRMGAGIIRGIQGQGVGACVKALCANNQQKDQHTTSVTVSERVLRELYLKVFEIAIRESEPCAAMTSYNPLNGENTAESAWLIKTVVKGDWGFPGLVVSDWRAVATPAVYRSGLDVEMPGPGKFLGPRSVLRAVAEGWMDPADVEESARRVLAVARRYGREEGAREQFQELLDSPLNRETARRAAEESIILLKNRDGLLPLDRREIRRLAVVGPNAAAPRLGGGGSASVTPFRPVCPLQGLREHLGDDVEILHEEGCGLVGSLHAVSGVFQTADGAPGLRAEFFNSGEPSGEPDVGWEVPSVDFSWGWAAPGPGVTRYEFAVRFSGSLVPRVSGVHRFGLYAQEGCARLVVNGQTLIEAWAPVKAENDFEGAYATRYETVEIPLTAGEPVSIRVEYGKRAARAAVRLEWEEPGTIDPAARAVSAAASADAVILCLGLSNLFEGGNNDRKSIDLPEAQVALLRRVVQANPRTVVVLNNGGPLAVPWEAEVPVILEAWYPGQAGGEALARMLFGEVNPSGKLPDTVPHRLEDHLAIKYYPGDGKEVRYEEGLFIGYRHFDKAGIEPHFPFGFGLSYSRFEISAPALKNATLPVGEPIRCSVGIRNDGPRDGKETIQLYLENPEAAEDEPARVLVGFKKVFLRSGESMDVDFVIGPEIFGEWDAATRSRQARPGRRILLAGPHSRSLRGAELEIADPRGIEGRGSPD